MWHVTVVVIAIENCSCILYLVKMTEQCQPNEERLSKRRKIATDEANGVEMSENMSNEISPVYEANSKALFAAYKVRGCASKM